MAAHRFRSQAQALLAPRGRQCFISERCQIPFALYLNLTTILASIRRAPGREILCSWERLQPFLQRQESNIQFSRIKIRE